MTAKTFKIPKTLGECADLLYQTKADRLAKEHEAEALKAQETALKEHIIKTLPKSKASGVAGKKARIAVANKEVPQVEDWDALYTYVKKNNAFELLQRRLADGAVKERLEANEKVPGVKIVFIPQVSINKL